VFVVDTKKEKIAVDEARKPDPGHRHCRYQLRSGRGRFRHSATTMRCDPIRLFASRMADSVIDGRDRRQSMDADSARDARTKPPRTKRPRRAADQRRLGASQQARNG
jgi:ribosomal protein S2